MNEIGEISKNSDALPVPTKLRRMDLIRAREILKRVSAIDPDTINSFEDLIRALSSDNDIAQAEDELTPALIIVGEHIIRTDPNFEHRNNIAHQSGITVASELLDGNAGFMRIILKYPQPKPDMPILPGTQIPLSTNQDFLAYMDFSYPPSEISLVSRSNADSLGFILDYKIGFIRNTRETINSIHIYDDTEGGQTKRTEFELSHVNSYTDNEERFFLWQGD